MIYVHGGMPKTATTTLQRYVFPRLAERNLIAGYNPADTTSALKRMTRGFYCEADIAEAQSYFRDHPGTLISVESLIGADPQAWEENCTRNREIFSQSATIIITIREPGSYLRSLYQQLIHQGNVVDPKYFFLTESEYDRCKFLHGEGNFNAINVDAFDLEKLVALYSANFQRVVVVALECIAEMEFLQAAFGFDDAQKQLLSTAFREAPRRNVAFSSAAMRLTFARDRLMRALGAKSAGSEDTKAEVYLDWMRGVPPRPEPRGLRRRLRNILNWRKFLQKILDRTVPYRKWELPPHTYLGSKQEANENYYRNLLAQGGYQVFENRRS